MDRRRRLIGGRGASLARAEVPRDILRVESERADNAERELHLYCPVAADLPDAFISLADRVDQDIVMNRG